MNEIKVFDNGQFGKLRTVVKDGEPWFVAAIHQICKREGRIKFYTRAYARQKQPRWVRRLRFRNELFPHDWLQTVAENRDRELPWLKYRY